MTDEVDRRMEEKRFTHPAAGTAGNGHLGRHEVWAIAVVAGGFLVLTALVGLLPGEVKPEAKPARPEPVCLVIVGRDRCVPCTWAKVDARKAGVPYVYVNLSKLEGVPHLVLIRGGKLVGEHTGRMGEARLRAWVDDRKEATK